MKRYSLAIIAVSVICVVASGSFSQTDPTEKSVNSTTSGSQKSGSSQLKAGSSSSTQIPQKTSPQPALKPAPTKQPLGKKTPIKISPPPSQLKTMLIGFCCKDGILTSLNKDECSRKRGVFYTDERKARAGCTGFCCKDGELQETTKEVCVKKLRGKFFADRKIALNSCRGWCCDDFHVSQMSARQCAAAQGKFFGTKPEADRFCNAQKGWCCQDGKITRKSRSECGGKGRNFFTSDLLARQSCKEKKGFCNIDGKTLSLTKTECIKRKGFYFSFQSQAVLDLAKTQQKKRLASVKESQKKTQKSIGAAGQPSLKEAPSMSLKPGKGDVLPGKTSLEVQTGYEKKAKGSPGMKDLGAASLIGSIAERQRLTPTKGEGDIQVVAPNGGEHWESCVVGYPRWRYYGDPAAMPAEFIVEFLRDGAREFMIRSRCTDFTDHGGDPSYRECIERSAKPCMETGNYLVRVSGGGTFDQSDGTFRIGISDDWPMISLLSPRGGRTYAQGGILPVRFYSNPSGTDLGMLIYKGDTVVVRLLEPGASGIDYDIPESFADGDDYRVRVFQRSNPDNFVESGRLTIGGTPVDFQILDIGSEDGINLYADLRASIGFSGMVSFRIDRLEPSYHGWTVARELRDSDGSRMRVNLGGMNLPADTSTFRCGLEYRVTVDADDIYEEGREDNNSLTEEVAFAADRGFIIVHQSGRINPPALTCDATRSPFSLELRNCGTSLAFGDIQIRQVGSWPDEPHAFPTSHNLVLYDARRSTPEGTNQFVRVDLGGTGRCQSSTIEIYHYGDFESWHSSNPIRVGLLPE